MVINMANHFHDRCDAEEIVRVGEQTHSCDYDRFEMVPLYSSYVKRRQYLYNWHRRFLDLRFRIQSFFCFFCFGWFISKFRISWVHEVKQDKTCYNL